MITFYNESKTPWSLVKINDKLNKISTSRSENKKYSKPFYYGLSLSSDLDISVEFDKLVDMTNCVTLSNEETCVGFRERDLKPWVHKNTRYNADIFVVTLDTMGKNITCVEGVKMLYWKFTKKGEFITYFTPKYEKGKVLTPVIKVMDKEACEELTYTFNYVNNDGESYYDLEVVKNSIPENTFIRRYEIETFKFIGVTKLVFVKEEDLDAFNKVKRNFSNNIVVVVNENTYMDAIEEKVKNNYLAATIFINNTTNNKVNKKDYLYDACVNKFRYLNALTKAGKIITCK